MATVVETYEREDGHKIAIYESGAQYDLTAGRLVGAPPRAQFTKETWSQGYDRRVELKREAILRGAARALEKTGEWETPTDMDVVEAISEAVTMKALNPDSPKQVDAARFVLQESKMAESQTSSSEVPSNFAQLGEQFNELARSIAQIVSDVMAAQRDAQLHERQDAAIDGEVRD